MATGLNRVSLIGNLGKDPEVRYSQSGTAVSNIRIGVTERRKEGDEYKDQTEWVSIVCFGKTAENVGKYLQKGRQIFVEGRLQTRSWEDKSGQTKYTTEVIASQILFLSGGREQSSNNGFAKPNDNFERESQDNGFIEDDDIPF